jgi:hypothetical protein
MRSKSFLQQAKQARAVNGIYLPPGMRTSRKWPLCLTCGREVEAVEMKDCNQHSVELWARCHGAEDFYRVEFGFRVEGDPMEDERANWAVAAAMRDFCPFDPNKVPK